MLRLETTGKQLVRVILSGCLWGSRSIPVMAEAQKGKHLRKPVALKNPAIVFGSYEPFIIQELFAIPDPVKVAYDVRAHE